MLKLPHNTSVTNNINTHKSAFEEMPYLFGPRIALGYGGLFLIFGILLPYFPVWLQSVGLTAKEIGIILFMPFLIRVLTSGLVTSYADKQNDRSNVISVLFVGSALASILYVFSDNFWWILTVTVIFNFFFNPIMPSIDAVTLAGVRRFNADYGRIRIWGSIVFVIANFSGGLLLASYEPQFLLYSIILTSFFAVAISFLLPRFGRKKNPETSNSTNSLNRANTNVIKNDKSFWKDKHFVLVLMAAGLVQASHAMLYGFGTIYWRDIGFSGSFIGMLWGVGVVAEVILFQFSTKLLKWMSPKQFILIGAIGAIIRWSIFPLIDEHTAWFVLQILHAITFGAVHIGTMHFIMHQVPEERIGSGQGVGFVLGGLATGLLLLASGSFFDAFHGNAFWIMALVGFIAIIILAIANKLTPSDHPHNNGVGGVTDESG